MEQLSINCQQN